MCSLAVSKAGTTCFSSTKASLTDTDTDAFTIFSSLLASAIAFATTALTTYLTVAFGDATFASNTDADGLAASLVDSNAHAGTAFSS